MYYKRVQLDDRSWHVTRVTKEEWIAAATAAPLYNQRSQTVRMGEVWFKEIEIWVSRKVRYIWMYEI
jgi:hypothetical protein